MQAEIKEFIEKQVGATITNGEDDLIDSGLLDSIEAMNLLVNLENQFKVTFSFAEYSKQGFFSLNRLVNVITAGTRQ